MYYDMDSCVFCAIAAGKIQSYKVYEDDSFLAFLDINPATYGHTLVIPKKHYADILEVPFDESGPYLRVVQKVATAVARAVTTDGFRVLTNKGKTAGQSVFHVHMHVIPMGEDATFCPKGVGWEHKTYAEGQANALTEKIRSFLDT